jgi:hypothetical protein
MRQNEMQFIDDRDFPGGPLGVYRKLVFRFPLPYMGEVVYFISAWLQDWLLVSESSCLLRCAKVLT